MTVTFGDGMGRFLGPQPDQGRPPESDNVRVPRVTMIEVATRAGSAFVFTSPTPGEQAGDARAFPSRPMKSCHRCGHAWPAQDQPGFNNTCEGCGTPVHCCSNCDHHRREGRVRCTEPQAPRILDASSANDCRLFRFRQRGLEPEAGQQLETLRRNLFEERSSGGPSAAPMSWDQLFSD